MKDASLRASLRLGLFLAIRDLKRSSKWTNFLIISIMTITFLNLVVVRGILVGLIAGATLAYREYYSSDILISAPVNKSNIENAPQILSVVSSLPGMKDYTYRYTAAAKIEAGYKEIKRKDQKDNSVAAQIAGIVPDKENNVTNLSNKIIEGQFLEDGDTDQIVIGANLLKKYVSATSPGNSTLENVGIGSKVLLTINGSSREVSIKGIVKSKVTQVDQRIFMNEKVVHQMLDRSDLNVNEIAIAFNPDVLDMKIKNILQANNVSKSAIVQTAMESRPQFVKDIEETFNILGNVIGSIGLAVATISIFIVIFVNAITRRKYIGILKGIGVTEHTIEYSYMFQSLFYALAGILVAVVLIFSFIKPYFNANPISFPFSDGIIVAGVDDVLARALVLLLATVIAGYIPARIVVKQHTLDAILGR